VQGCTKIKTFVFTPVVPGLGIFDAKDYLWGV
jgi:hypothetical protein